MRKLRAHKHDVQRNYGKFQRMKTKVCGEDSGNEPKQQVGIRHIIKSLVCQAKRFTFYPESDGELLKDFKQRGHIIQLAYYESWRSDMNWQQLVLRRWRIVLAKIDP